MKKPTIYLCGAINGCTDSEAKDWREKVKRQLGYSYQFLDPMRRDYRGREDDCVDEIVYGDYADIAQSDIILAAADRPSWGTAMEIHHAFGIGKRVISVCEGRVSPWLRKHSTTVMPALDVAIYRLLCEAMPRCEELR